MVRERAADDLSRPSVFSPLDEIVNAPGASFHGNGRWLDLAGLLQGLFEDKPFAIDVFQPAQRTGPERRAVHPASGLSSPGRLGTALQILEVPVPDGKPFPHLNHAAEFRGGNLADEPDDAALWVSWFSVWSLLSWHRNRQAAVLNWPKGVPLLDVHDLAGLAEPS